MRLWLIRHPKPAVPEGTCYGRTDVDTDAQHFEAVVARLRGLHDSDEGPTPLQVYSSPLSRCARVAQALSGAPWPEPVIEPLLAEMHFGHWEGKDWSAIPRDEINAWRDNIEHWRPPGGETVTELAGRGWRFLQSITPQGAAASGPRPAVAVLTHAGVILTLLKQVRGEPLNQFGGLKIDFGSVHHLEHDERGWRVVRENV
jgi:alpha-ribazole phosphatase